MNFPVRISGVDPDGEEKGLIFNFNEFLNVN
jgi:hypothetical protein